MYRNITHKMLNEFQTSQPEISPFIADLDIEKAINASSGVSQFPERHAAFHIASYAQSMAKIKADLKTAVARANKNGISMPENIDNEIDNEINCFKPKLVSAYYDFFHSLSRCMSTHVTGASNFPVARQQKRHSAADNKQAAISELIQKATKRMIKSLLPNGDGTVIRSDSDNALESLEAKLDKLTKNHELMKKANQVIRSTLKQYDSDKEKCINSLMTKCGLSPQQAESLLEPDHMGKCGFPRYSLTNNSQEIKRIKTRIEVQKQLEEHRNEHSSIAREFSNGITTELSDDNKIVIYFIDKPSDDVRTTLKRRAFKWSTWRNAWVRKHTLNAERDFECYIVPVLEAIE